MACLDWIKAPPDTDLEVCCLERQGVEANRTSLGLMRWAKVE